jgi:uncharacterized protein YkwD
LRYYGTVLLFAIAAALSGCATLLEDLETVFAPDSSVEQERQAPASETERPSERIATPIIVDEDGPFRGEFAGAEEHILALVNDQRTRHGLEPLIISSELAVVARDHSSDMGERGFYSHVDPEGITPNERITAAMGDTYYLAGTSENIAYTESSRGFAHQEHTAIAEQLMNGWMNSPGHRANILRDSSTHIGIGLHRSGNRIYATQKFMRYIVAHDDAVTSRVVPADDPIVRYHINPGLKVSRSDFVVRVSLPDPNARWTTDNGSFYRGIMFPDPIWIDETVVEIVLPVEYGPGTYQVHFGTQGGNGTSTTAFEYTVEE